MSVPELPEDFDVFAIREHPAAAVFPMLSDEKLRSLANDIADHTLRHPVVVCRLDHEWLLLDGRNRRAACKLAEVECKAEVYDNIAGHVAYVVSANMQRRDLTRGQRAMAAAALANLGHGQRKAAGRRDSSIEPSRVTLPEAAAMMGVTLTDAKRARKVSAAGIPELAEAVNAGTSVSAAAVVARLPEAEQRKAVTENRVAEVAKEVREAAAVADPVVVTKTSFRPAEDVEAWDEWTERDWLLDLRSTLRDARDEWVRQKGSVRGLLSNVRLWLSLMEKEDE